jgi:hypothetical protein
MRSVAALLLALGLSTIVMTSSPERTALEAARAALGVDAIKTLQFHRNPATLVTPTVSILGAKSMS